MSKAGTTTIASNGSSSGLFRNALTAAARIPSSRPLVRSRRSGCTPSRAAQAATTVVVVGIDCDVLTRESLQRGDHSWRTAGGVLVEVQSQRVSGCDGAFVLVAHPSDLFRVRRGAPIRRSRIVIDAACAVRPSARASATPAGAIRRSPAAVSRWTVDTRTKSAALSPPRPAAAPLVGRTWLDPVT